MMESLTKHRYTISDFSSEEDNSDFDDYYASDNDANDGNVFHPSLEDDIGKVKEIYGPEAISCRLYSAVDSIDVELSFQTKMLDREIAIAWKIKPEEPIIVRLHLSLTNYLDGNVPKVEVFQPSQKEKFGIGSQLTKILENFLSKEWKNLRNSDLQPELKVTDVSSASNHNMKDELNLNSNSAQPADDNYSDALKKITDMGFSKQMAENALVMSRFDLLEAINILTNSDHCMMMPPVDSGQQANGVKLLTHAGLKSKCHGRSSEKSTVGSILSKITTAFNPSSLMGVQLDPKRRPDLSDGFLVMIMKYVYQRLPTMNEFCVVCDEPHVFDRGGMLKPAVCARELCTFSFLSLGVMSDAADDIATQAEVVNLLIVMADAACESSQRLLIFDPYPTIVNPLKPNELALSPEKQDFVKLKSILNNFPSFNKMMHLREAELKKEMDKRDILAYPLLQWIISSNRSHIVKLPKEKQLDFMQTPHQFLLRSSPPAREAIFREAKNKYGSTFAFHGSPLENWHSILRKGLINASGTKYQRHGAAYGKGIYLSPHSDVSFGYCGKRAMRLQPVPAKKGTTQAKHGQPSHGRFLSNSIVTCIALCEVISSPGLKKNGNIWVMPEPDHVCTRFFFVYEDGQKGDVVIDSTNPSFSEKIQKAVQYQIT